MSESIVSVCKKKLVSKDETYYEIEAINFTMFSPEDILRYAELKILNKELYKPLTNEPMPYGVLDSKLGPNKSSPNCVTCGNSFQQCPGHWGYIELKQPVFHIGYFKHLINLLYCICKRCSRLLVTDEQKAQLLRRTRVCSDPILRRMLTRSIVAKCKKESQCLNPECNAPQGVLQKIMKPSLDQFMKIVLQKKINAKSSKTSSATLVNEDLNASYVLQLLLNISPIDCEILDVRNPEKFLISSLLVPPKCIRPSVSLGDSGTNEDDLTVIFSEIVDLNNIIAAQTAAGLQSNTILNNIEFLQLQCTRFINSKIPAVAPLLASKNISSPGKEGRFRGNLSGKRVDFSARTVISPDMNCSMLDIVVPEWAAKRLTFPEKVSQINLKQLKQTVMRGDVWPGAAFILKSDGFRISLKYANCYNASENLEIGDVVERHLFDGDIVLFNRQPSLHRLSIMAHRAKVRPWRTFRFNECVCAPYNADFDGDEMNCHLPQTQEARAEAYQLMSVVNNLVTPKNGEPLIAATQDFLCGAYCLTSKDVFLTREKFAQFCCYFCDASMSITLPPPTIMKPMELWTGKQIINVLICPNKNSCNVAVTFELKEREFIKPVDEPPFMCPRDGYVMFIKSELICGAIAKTTLGSGSKKGLFFHLIRENNNRIAAECMCRIAKLTGRWLSNKGMTIGIDDVTPSKSLQESKKLLLEKGLKDVQSEIMSYEKETMTVHPGCTLEQTLEARIKYIFDDLRNLGGKIALTTLSPNNKPLIMFLSGAKGALINIAQMVALVGQQNVGGFRIQSGFVNRTLPHFHYTCQTGKSRGFVEHSFFDGLEPEEFFFHTMSGREGLVDTAVKTAETGYMQRRLVKALEDLSSAYDCTVRTSDHHIVQFVYGDDGLNPAVMEEKSKPINFEKVYNHITKLNLTKYLTLTSEAEFQSEAINEQVDIQINDRAKKAKCIALSASTISTEKALKTESNSAYYSDSSILPPPSYIEAAIEFYLFHSLMPNSANNYHIYQSMSAKNFASYSEIEPKMPSFNELSEAMQQKILVLRSLNCDHPMYNCVKLSILFFLVSQYWLNEIKQNAPLLPFEIIQWGDYFCRQYSDFLPLPLKQHQKACIEESQTHQESTMTAYTIVSDIQNWVKNKASDIATYRNRVGMLSGDTVESYMKIMTLYNDADYGSNFNFSSINKDSFCRRSKFPKDPILRRGWVIENQEDHLNPNPKLYRLNKHYWVTGHDLFSFFQLVLKKYTRTLIEPSEAVGAIGAQSIGEPGTQMTLKTFHFAGVASMNVTLGVPRIKEIINAAVNIMTPIIQVPLMVDNDLNFAVMVKNRIEQTVLSEVTSSIKEVYDAGESYLLIDLNLAAIQKCFLEVDAQSVAKAISKSTSLNSPNTKLKDLKVSVISPKKISVHPPLNKSTYFDIQYLKQKLQNVHVAGLKMIKRGVVKAEDKADKSRFYSLAVEGSGLLEVMGIIGVLGIEVARRVIIEEIQNCMNAYSMDIDCRHMQLLGDVMTFRGDVLGISRFGIQKMKGSTLLLASFEETNEHLFEAAAHNRQDLIRGVSESIIMGKLITVGTGSFDLFYDYKKACSTSVNPKRPPLLLTKYAY